MPDVEPGRLLSHYRVVQQIGRGGMGEVYVAFDETLERKVALKALRSDRRLSPEARERFLAEARMLSRLDHPNICLIYDHFQVEDRDFLVLELIDGTTLRTALGRRMDRERALRIARQVGDALVAAHATGIVHRDLKPENIMLTEGDAVKVLDFGLARTNAPGLESREDPDTLPDPAYSFPGKPIDQQQTLAESQTPTRAESSRGYRTREGALMGTVAYMSPEQAQGRPATPASDMFTFGLILHEMLTGQVAYPRGKDSEALLRRVAHAEASPVTGVSSDLADLIARLESPAPSRRPTAVEAVDRLTWVLDKPRRRLRWIAAGAVLLLMALVVIKYTIDLGRERAVAERRREQAEDLIEFMIGDLRDKLAPVGRLDVLDDVGDEAMNYFATVPETEITAEDLSRRSKVLYQIGEVRMSQGNLQAAQRAFEESLTLATGLAARDPANGAWQLGLATSHFWVGYAHFKQRHLDEAFSQFEAYREIAEQLVARDPDSTDYQLELGYAHSNIAQVLEAKGDLSQALESYRRGKQVEERLAAQFPDEASYRVDLAGSHNTIGRILDREGDLAGALDQFRAERALLEALVEEDPRNTYHRELLARSDNFAGRALLALGREDEAIDLLTEAVSLLEELVRIDPDHANRQRSLGVGRFRLAMALRIARPDPVRRDLLGASEATARTLAVEDPTDWAKQHDLARVLIYEAEVDLDEGIIPRARARVREALEMLERVLRDHPGERDLLRLTGLAHVIIARADAAEDPGSASASWSRAREILEPLADGTSDHRMLEPLARALILGGHPGEAASIVDRLRSIGYARRDFLMLCESHGLVQ